MCTVVVRWVPGEPVLALALRDELVGRDFDDPGTWWPGSPGVVGGRDRTAGGSWCVTDPATGVTALVLNRPQRRLAAPGAPSRGVLPLLAVRGDDWPERVELAGMASFALLRVAPAALTLWVFDGQQLTTQALDPGTHMVTSGGAEDGKAGRFLAAFEAAPTEAAWRALVAQHEPRDDPAALVVRHPVDGAVYATVFGQTLVSTPGSLSLAWSRTPWRAGTWTGRVFGS